jgi:hypothetical protein
MDDKYQCHICMELASKPVVTPCGHLFWYRIYYLIKLVGLVSIIGYALTNNI